VVKRSDVFIKQPAQKIQNVLFWHLGKEGGNVEADEDIIGVDPESAQCEDVFRILNTIRRFPQTWPPQTG